MSLSSEHLDISWQFLSDKAEELGIALRTETPSCHLSNTAFKSLKLRQKGNPGWQRSAFVHSTNNGISFVPNSVPNRRKFPAFLLLVLLLLCASRVDAHYHSPQNMAVNVGDVVFMNCSFNDTENPCQKMVWTHYTAHNLAPTVIFMDGKLSPLVSGYISIVDSNDGYCNLEIKAQTSAEGQYVCSSPSTNKKESASLIILAGYPECTVKTVREYSNITCWVRYFGDWAPTMEWIKITGQNSRSISSYEFDTSNQIVSANLMVPRHVPSSYKYIMKFNETGRKTTAINVPDYEWISPIFVLGEDGGEGGGEIACPVQTCSANSFGLSGSVVILSLLIWILKWIITTQTG